MRLVFPTRIRTALFAGLLLGGLAVAVAQPPSDQSAPPQSAPLFFRWQQVGSADFVGADVRRL